MYVPQINDIKLGKLINIKDPYPQEIMIKNIKLFNTVFEKSVQAETLQCNLKEATLKLKYPQVKKWKSMKITKNVTLWDEDISLFQLVNNTFHMKKHNVITGTVTYLVFYFSYFHSIFIFIHFR